jgi:hypothetical protein
VGLSVMRIEGGCMKAPGHEHIEGRWFMKLMMWPGRPCPRETNAFMGTSRPQ